MKVWIDLDNSPHVPFFAPIIAELKNRGLSITLTARDAFQVCDLANLFHLKYKSIGRHYGKNRMLKLGGTCLRALQLLPIAVAEKPQLALSHGSRAQLLLCAVMHVPSAVIIDYEHAKGLGLMRPDWVMVPEIIPDGALGKDKHILKYPGIKEDVYVPAFKPNSAIMSQLGLSESDLVVTLRPPATEAHYHNPESEELLKAVIDLLKTQANARIVLLPRNKRQESVLREAWSDLFATRKIAIPEQAVDGLNLIWHSDIVISGGGTMNREAAALGVPVYSIFRGPIGAVDRYLAGAGRLVLLENCEDVRTKIALKRRDRRSEPTTMSGGALKKIVDDVVSIVEQQHHEAH
jgi:uncharacterized protein